MKGAQIDEENGKWVNTPAPEHAFALIRALGLPTAA